MVIVRMISTVMISQYKILKKLYYLLFDRC